MPKSTAQRAKESIARKRLHAREAGLCCVCCKHKPDPGKVVCLGCNAAKRARERRQRQRDREATALLQIAVAHETAGDKAREHHLFDSAARHIQDALNIAIITPGDRQRLLAKLSEVSHYTTNPVAANTWNAGVLTSYLNDIETTEKVERAVQLLL